MGHKYRVYNTVPSLFVELDGQKKSLTNTYICCHTDFIQHNSYISEEIVAAGLYIWTFRRPCVDQLAVVLYNLTDQT